MARNSFNLFMPRALASPRLARAAAAAQCVVCGWGRGCVGCLLKNAKDCSAAIRLALEHATVLALPLHLSPSLSACLRHVASSLRA